MAHRLHVNGHLATTAGVVAAGLAVGRWLLHESRRIDFLDRHVLITGGSHGLGLAVALQFAREHAHLSICSRDEGELERAGAELTAAGAQVRAFVADMTNAAQVRQLIPDAESHWGPIDVVVNNAGVIQNGSHDSLTVDDYDRAMRTHFWGPLYVIQAVLPSMRQRRFGRIVNIASITGKVSVPELLPYSTSKFAFVGLSEGLRAALAKDNVYVTTVCPGLGRDEQPLRPRRKRNNRAVYALFAGLDSTPEPSSSAMRAARRIVEACRYAEAEVVIGVPARAAAWVHGLWPGMTSEALGILTRLLPKSRSGPPSDTETDEPALGW
jgi:NAD(P)-dependent dehydrogenase (short-subunit alcohol dehydrogenase family)